MADGRSRGELRASAERIFRAGLAAVDPYEAVRSSLRRREGAIVLAPGGGPERRLETAGLRRVLVVGAGKATTAMARAAEDVLSDLPTEGLVCVKTGHGGALRTVRVVEASHPVPDAAGEAAAREVLRLVDEASDDTLVLALISGGGSALWPAPADRIRLEDKQAVTDLLLAAGAEIRELNAVRKHISSLKGGRLAERAHPARLVTLVLSDVVGDPLDVIASGPTVPDRSTFADALGAIERHGLGDRAPRSVMARLEAGARGEVAETPKPGDPVFARAETLLVGTNALALEAAVAAARAEGFRATLLASTIEGEASVVGRLLAAVAREIRRSGSPLPPPACVVSGGETTVTVRGAGLGGRNQELALAAALELAGEEGVAVLAVGTDGTDGPTDAAGAIAFGDTVERAAAAGLDARAMIADNDSYRFFDALGDLVRTGPTGTNVMDLHLVLVDHRNP